MSAQTKFKRRIWLTVAIATFGLCWFVPIVETSPHGEHVPAWTAFCGLLRSEYFGRLDCIRFGVGWTSIFGLVAAAVGWGAATFFCLSRQPVSKKP